MVHDWSEGAEEIKMFLKKYIEEIRSRRHKTAENLIIEEMEGKFKQGKIKENRLGKSKEIDLGKIKGYRLGNI